MNWTISAFSSDDETFEVGPSTTQSKCSEEESRKPKPKFTVTSHSPRTRKKKVEHDLEFLHTSGISADHSHSFHSTPSPGNHQRHLHGSKHRPSSHSPRLQHRGSHHKHHHHHHHGSREASRSRRSRSSKSKKHLAVDDWLEEVVDENPDFAREAFALQMDHQSQADLRADETNWVNPIVIKRSGMVGQVWNHFVSRPSAETMHHSELTMLATLILDRIKKVLSEDLERQYIDPAQDNALEKELDEVLQGDDDEKRVHSIESSLVYSISPGQKHISKTHFFQHFEHALKDIYDNLSPSDKADICCVIA